LGSQALNRIHTLPIGEPLVKSRGAVRSVIVWAVVAAVAGGLTGLAIQIVISVLTERPLDLWFVQQSVLFAEAVGLSGLVAARYAFPLFESLAPALRYCLVLMTLLGSAITVTALSVALRPGALATRPASLIALVGANTVLALVVGGVLITWERMKRSLAQAYEDLRIKEAFEREMALARDVQQALLPERPPEVEGYQIAARCRSAALVGGDTMDFIALPGGRLGLAVGDVSGKGIAAALLMANVQALMRGVAALEPDPARINAILSEALESRLVAGRYVTFAYVVLELGGGLIRYSLAGHPAPLIAGEDGVRRLDRGGVPLGLIPGAVSEGGEDRLRPGETLVMYTDGLTEAPGGGNLDREFGEPRLAELLARAKRPDAEHVLQEILAALDSHLAGAPPQDDTTIIVVHRPGAAS
jgi:sigma-B regulation protein RsbU (phosphoserine phosphatase)